MDLSILTPYTSPFPLRRVGNHNDGGYVIAHIPNLTYQSFITAGIGSDISFEDQFIDIYEPESAVGFDGTIDSCDPVPGFTWVKKNIGPVSNETETNLEEYVRPGVKTFLKMDIEGFEVDWILSAKDSLLSTFDQIVIEFHGNFFTERGHAALKRLQDTHTIIHFHANNNGGIHVLNGLFLPYVFELTLVHKKHLEKFKLEKNSKPLPLPIDEPNNPTIKDIIFECPPFVYR